MDLHQLRCFLHVAQEQHFGRAAELLHMTPSPVSRAVKSLEAELGVQLFERRYHTVKLTAAGQLLVTGATSLIEQLDDLKRSVVSAASGAAVPIVVGGSPFAPAELFDRVTDQIRAAAGSRAVHIDVADWEKFPERISRNEMDLAVLNLPFHHPAVDHVVVAELELRIAMRSDDALAAHKSVTWDDLRYHQLTIPRRTPQPTSLTAVRDQIDQTRTCEMDEVIATDVISLAAHVRGSRGRFLLALPAAAGGPWKVLDDPAFTVTPFRAGAPTFSVCVAWNRRRYGHDHTYAALVDAVADHWRAAPQTVFSWSDALTDAAGPN
jgi:DNA-binding transcriptional LysR family regulator